MMNLPWWWCFRADKTQPSTLSCCFFGVITRKGTYRWSRRRAQKRKQNSPRVTEEPRWQQNRTSALICGSSAIRDRETRHKHINQAVHVPGVWRRVSFVHQTTESSQQHPEDVAWQTVATTTIGSEFGHVVIKPSPSAQHVTGRR